MTPKRVVRWRLVSDRIDWSCWTLDGDFEQGGTRVIMSHKKTKKFPTEDDRILSILHSYDRRRRRIGL